jgi:hypothetical protein
VEGAESEDLVRTGPFNLTTGRLTQVVMGAVATLVAWPVIDVLVRWTAESQLNPGRTALLSLTLVLAGVVLVAVLAWTFVGLLTAGALSFVLILFGLLLEEAPNLPANFEFLLLRGAHEPAIHILTGSWIALGVTGWLRSRARRQSLSS